MARPITRDPNQCVGKVPFRTFTLASKISKRRLQQRDKYNRQIPYKCEVCGNWHIGTKRDDL